jgi:hypothetical protein
MNSLQWLGQPAVAAALFLLFPAAWIWAQWDYLRHPGQTTQIPWE